MEILKNIILVVTIAAFTFSALVVREDRKNEHVWATFVLCGSMAILTCVQW